MDLFFSLFLELGGEGIEVGGLVGMGDHGACLTL